MGRDCVGVLLAGGAARRFGGGPKGLSRIDGRRIADHALHALRQATASLVVVANDPYAVSWFPGASIIADAQRGLGPLAGIEAGFAAADGSAIIVLAWDMPFVPGALLCELARRGQRGSRAVVPVHGEASWREPLCAYYPPEALSVCRTLLTRGERHASALATALPTTEFLRDDALSAFGDPSVMFTSIDTPEQLAALGGALP